ncbi:methylenetetrahydrofolate reductase [NAD(P)H] [Aureliella helgolandensis]|uniref:Methylenetetrahydrofolate reductase n=1 Tax=Aureliella helgolandensis TaxID=2527968 RepID=A0A518G391_9BACT|nr:methylenetetrahydrofolate reductase [NAD(P)H] [Aureliella helgolandensis]QDV23045.1 5,10-methylenetetrahydrofolate reductase [Aureliella helgolandensis]
MSLAKLFSPDRCVLSFELFPPKSDDGVQDLLNTVVELNAQRPDFFTCTYGAGGSTRDRTLTITSQIRATHQVPVASHLTCVGSTRDQLREYLKTARERGIDYIVALRGDPPKGEASFTAVAGGLRYANELVELIRNEFPHFGILVAGYPEVHQEAVDATSDMANLVRKVDAGADAIVTQLFYDNDDFFRFRDQCVAAGIRVPIVPGLLPVLSLKQVQRIASLCKAKLPNEFLSRLQQTEDLEAQFEIGVDHAAKQTQGLIDSGVPGIHFYVLNKCLATNQILGRVTGLQR